MHKAPARYRITTNSLIHVSLYFPGSMINGKNITRIL